MQECLHNSIIDNGMRLKLESIRISSAKREVSKRQLFCGTILKLYENDILIAIKDGAFWKDVEN